MKQGFVFSRQTTTAAPPRDPPFFTCSFVQGCSVPPTCSRTLLSQNHGFGKVSPKKPLAAARRPRRIPKSTEQCLEFAFEQMVQAVVNIDPFGFAITHPIIILSSLRSLCPLWFIFWVPPHLHHPHQNVPRSPVILPAPTPPPPPPKTHSPLSVSPKG